MIVEKQKTVLTLDKETLVTTDEQMQSIIDAVIEKTNRKNQSLTYDEKAECKKLFDKFFENEAYLIPALIEVLSRPKAYMPEALTERDMLDINFAFCSDPDDTIDISFNDRF